MLYNCSWEPLAFGKEFQKVRKLRSICGKNNYKSVCFFVICNRRGMMGEKMDLLQNVQTAFCFQNITLTDAINGY